MAGMLLVYGLRDAMPDPNHRPPIRRLADGRRLVSWMMPPSTSGTPAAASFWLADGRSGAPLIEPRRGPTLVSPDERWKGMLVSDGRLAAGATAGAAGAGLAVGAVEGVVRLQVAA